MTSLRSIGEFGLISRISRRLHTDPSVAAGIGDDAAVLEFARGRQLLFASDMLVEGVHFLRARTPARDIGWKALASNISDIAAMGGRPHWAVVSLGAPPKTPVSFIDGVYAGLERCARRFGVSIVGGDTVRAPQLIIDVAIIGSVARNKAVLRSGVRVGDLLFVTGSLGGSYKSGRHARFTPRLKEAQQLLRCVRVHAMMDLSDGLAKDLWQMSRASRVRLQIDASQVPIARFARTLRHAVMDGEDFELLFAVAPGDLKRVPKRLGACPVTRIGRAVRSGIGVEMIAQNRTVKSLKPEGFAHFS